MNEKAGTKDAQRGNLLAIIGEFSLEVNPRVNIPRKKSRLYWFSCPITFLINKAALSRPAFPFLTFLIIYKVGND